MQKQHSHRTFSETIRCFRLNGHFFERNLMGWPSLTRYYKATNSAQITCFVVNFDLDIFFMGFFLFYSAFFFLKWLKDLFIIYQLPRLWFLKNWLGIPGRFCSTLMWIRPVFKVIAYYFSLDFMPAKTIDRSIPIIIKWRGCKLIPCSSK